MTIRYSEGGVTVDLGGALESLVVRALDAAQTETVRELRIAAEEVASSARAKWYGSEGVERRTGLSGDIRDVLTIDATAGTVRVSVGSTDKRLADDGKPLPVYVHRPRATSAVLVDAPTTQAWYDAPESLRGPWRIREDGKRWPQLFVANPAARDGKMLLPLFVRVPMRVRVKAIVQRLGTDIVRKSRKVATQ